MALTVVELISLLEQRLQYIGYPTARVLLTAQSSPDEIEMWKGAFRAEIIVCPTGAIPQGFESFDPAPVKGSAEYERRRRDRSRRDVSFASEAVASMPAPGEPDPVANALSAVVSSLSSGVDDDDALTAMTTSGVVSFRPYRDQKGMWRKGGAKNRPRAPEPAPVAPQPPLSRFAGVARRAAPVEEP